jgi:hypothetical protein
MAGAGYKLFATGDVLTAAQVNTYLMQQTVMVFASSTARTTALSGVLAEGMVSYLQDTNLVEVYDGTAWVGFTGDITGLTAGTGISITNATGPVPTVAIDSTVATLTGTQTLTNKTLTTPVISSITNTGTLTLPTTTDTLVGRATTDTLTNKTLTAPRITSASNIADANGNELIVFPAAVASAVNEITVTNAITAGTPSIAASGSDANVSLNLVAKGTGTVQAGGVPVVTTTGTQTLTNKTLTTPVISSISNTGTLTLPTSTDTLVGRATTDTLTNKTLTTPVINIGQNTPTFTTNAYTLVLGDAYEVLLASNGATAGTINIPTNATAAFATGTQITIIQTGSGQLTITATTPATTTILSTGATAASPKLRAQYSSATLIKTGTDTWYVVGDLA